MTDHLDRIKLYEELVQRVAGAVRAIQLYSTDHPVIERTLGALEEAIRLLHAQVPVATFGLVGGSLVGGDLPLTRVSTGLREFIGRLESRGMERIAIERGVTRDEITTFLKAVVARGAEAARLRVDADTALALPHIRAGRLQVDVGGSGGGAGGTASARQMYGKAVESAQAVWESASTEQQPDISVARDTIEGLVEALTTNRAAVLGLTAMKHYDNYTYTHMVNVAILTMGQARAVGIEGRLLRDFGLAGLMHDLGKVRTPTEILTKPERLTEAEFAIMKRHVIDGAEILRRTPEMPALAPVVAFEHHLRPDGTGYPERAHRTTLNLGTLLCGIADVYDAMRSKRAYQQSFPTERIMAVYKGHDGVAFDQHLIRRFVQLLGIYPPGTWVRLSTGETAIVVRAHAPDPFRPAVRVMFDRHGERTGYDVNLWERLDDDEVSVISTLDPTEFDMDPIEAI